MKAFWLIVLLGILGFIGWRSIRQELPQEVSLEMASGEKVSGTLIGLEDNVFTIEGNGSTRTIIKRSELSTTDQLLSHRFLESPVPPTRFPIRRTIVSADGRSFEGKITGKSGSTISVVRISDNESFVIPIETLSPNEIVFVQSLPDEQSEAFETARTELERQARVSGRKATWHRNLANALSESRRYKLPIVLVFKSSGGADSGDIDKNVFQTPEFRTWADQNAVLCLYYGRTDLDTATNSDALIVARRYKVRTTPSVVLLDENGEKLKGSRTMKGYKGELAGPFIAKLEEEIADSKD